MNEVVYVEKREKKGKEKIVVQELSRLDYGREEVGQLGCYKLSWMRIAHARDLR